VHVCILVPVVLETSGFQTEHDQVADMKWVAAL